jgi:hemolysin activation/secretion protein
MNAVGYVNHPETFSSVGCQKETSMYFGNFHWPADVPMTRLRSRLLIFGLCVAAGLPGTAALAQTPPNLSAVPVGSPLPRIMPPAAPEVGPGLVAPAPHPLHNPLPGAQVQVSSAELLGATVYPPGRFNDLLAPLNGTVDETRIEEVRSAILATYRADGYVFTAVSATLESGGRLVFRAVEGRIVEVKLDGNIGPAGVQVLRFLNHLTDGGPLNVAKLERWLLLAQDVPGVTLRTVLRPSTDDPGALSLVAQVSRRKLSALVTADNAGYSNTGPEEGVVSISANSFTEYGERTDATIFYTARSTEIFGQAATELFLGASGLKLRVYAGRGTTDPTGSLGQIGYHGDTFIAGSSLSYPVIRERQQSLTVSAFFDMLDGTIYTGANTVQTVASNDNLRVFRLGADYALHDMWLGGDRSAVSSVNVRFSQGVPSLGASSQGDPSAGRLNERIDFTKISFEASRTQVLFTPWQNATVALQPLLAGQYSRDVLPSAEEFFLGGLRFNRGFYSGQLTGDKALTAATELQLNTSFPITSLGDPFDLGSQFYGFYDWGETWQNQKTDPSGRLASAGLGVRLYFPKAVEVDLEGVERLTRRPLGVAAEVNQLPGTGMYWRLLCRF